MDYGAASPYAQGGSRVPIEGRTHFDGNYILRQRQYHELIPSSWSGTVGMMAPPQYCEFINREIKKHVKIRLGLQMGNSGFLLSYLLCLTLQQKNVVRGQVRPDPLLGWLVGLLMSL